MTAASVALTTYLPVKFVLKAKQMFVVYSKS